VLEKKKKKKKKKTPPIFFQVPGNKAKTVYAMSALDDNMISFIHSQNHCFLPEIVVAIESVVPHLLGG